MHRQDNTEVIPSPLSGGPDPHTDSFPRVQAITPALHRFKAQLSTALDTDPCCTSDLRVLGQESKGGTSGHHPQSLVRNYTNPFAKAGTRLLLEGHFPSPLIPFQTSPTPFISNGKEQLPHRYTQHSITHSWSRRRPLQRAEQGSGEKHV